MDLHSVAYWLMQPSMHWLCEAKMLAKKDSKVLSLDLCVFQKQTQLVSFVDEKVSFFPQLKSLLKIEMFWKPHIIWQQVLELVLMFAYLKKSAENALDLLSATN